MRIGVLTGGGDCPGLNAVIRAVVRKGVKEYGYEFIGFKGLQFFQRIDVENRTAKFKDKDFLTNLSTLFYPKNFTQQTDSLYNENQWQSYSHQTGIKGIFRGFTYRTYFKQRYWDVNNPMAAMRKNRLENYVGLFLQQKFNDKIDGLILGIKYDNSRIKAEIELRIYINLSKKFNFFTILRW